MTTTDAGRRADLVLEGGGVKGLGTAGAVMACSTPGGPSRGSPAPRWARWRPPSPRPVPTPPSSATCSAGWTSGGSPTGGVPLPLVSEGVSLLMGHGAYAGDWIHELAHPRARRASASARSPTCAATTRTTTRPC